MSIVIRAVTIWQTVMQKNSVKVLYHLLLLYYSSLLLLNRTV